MIVDKFEELPIHNLSERHPGITDAVGANYTEAARVCLDRHHQSPVNIEIRNNNNNSSTVRM
jgi:hypothetical protein